MLVQLDHLPKVRGEHEKYLKPPPSIIGPNPHPKKEISTSLKTCWERFCASNILKNVVFFSLVNLPPLLSKEL